ncbi:hypothetical protein DPSP01_013715 [Paraphaeosphaeria sporulosa]|uniref:Uncharacterized protein n=1 Tax=Paraphaeosphaeria sporulosa TaxID=1460663 RepID=A0A177CHB9_9PLEO|nr:uncharacterized protein CC84DRAFT_755803 [Paraphaeosphaeria sporulosa]OAG06239.1 hypothetical protein CC84DRAFT_755803 [Paraphaeosphaeria sporulosa]
MTDCVRTQAFTLGSYPRKKLFVLRSPLAIIALSNLSVLAAVTWHRIWCSRYPGSFEYLSILTHEVAQRRNLAIPDCHVVAADRELPAPTTLSTIMNDAQCSRPSAH